MSKLYFQPRKKSFLLISLALMCLLTEEIILIPPQGILAFVFFFLIFFGAFYYLLRFIFNNFRPALLVSIGLTLFVGLRFLGLHHWLYPLLIGAIIVTIEVYFQRKLNLP